jgi:type IV secretion system protein VirB8
MSTALVSEGREAEHFAEARDWEADRTSRLERSEKRAWRVAMGSGVAALAAVIGIASLAPFKSAVPYVFTVDKATGNVELVSAADDRQMMGYQELTDKHWAQRYVVARESYYWSLLQSDYDTVLRLSADEVGREYARIYDGEDARDKKFGSSIEMRVKVLSVGVASDAVGSRATVRFEKSAKRTQSDKADPPQYFVATLAYEYKPSMKGQEIDLIQNPLGFKVLSYRVDSELAPVAPAGAAAASSIP